MVDVNGCFHCSLHTRSNWKMYACTDIQTTVFKTGLTFQRAFFSKTFHSYYSENLSYANNLGCSWGSIPIWFTNVEPDKLSFLIFNWWQSMSYESLISGFLRHTNCTTKKDIEKILLCVIVFLHSLVKKVHLSTDNLLLELFIVFFLVSYVFRYVFFHTENKANFFLKNLFQFFFFFKLCWPANHNSISLNLKWEWESWAYLTWPPMRTASFSIYLFSLC